MSLSTLVNFMILIVYTIHCTQTTTIFYNGKIFTSQEKNEELSFVESIAVNHNKIIAMGTSHKILSEYDNNDIDVDITKFDLHQQVMMPGINDAHVHIQCPPSNGVYLNDESFVPSPGPTVSDIINILTNATQLHASDENTIFYIFVGDAFRDAFMDENNNKYRNPRQVLSEYAPNHGVVVYQWSRHCAFINDKTMQMIGIGIQYNEQDICNGIHSSIFGDDLICNETNNLIGIAEEYSMWSILRLIADAFIDIAQVIHNYKTYMYRANQMGITSVQNMPISITNQESLKALSILDKNNELTLRWRSIHFSTHPDDINEFVKLTKRMKGMNPDKLWNYFGIKYIMDGTPIEQNAYMKRAYKQKRNGKEWFGKLNVNNLYDILSKELEIHSHENDINNQLLVHIVGDKSTQIVMETLKNVSNNEKWKNKRLRLEHGDTIYDYLDIVLEYDAIIVQNPTHTSIPHIFESRWGKMDHILPFQSVLNHSIHFAFGSDNMLINPWIDLFFALTHPVSNGRESMSLKNSLIAYTVGSAYAEFMESVKGKIDIGYLADLIVLNVDIFGDNFEPEMLFATQSVLTMVDGTIVYKDEDHWIQLQSKSEL